MDKYKVEFMTPSGRFALEIYASSEIQANNEVKRLHPNLTTVFLTTNLSSRDRERDNELKQREEDRRRERDSEEEYRREQELLSQMTKEEQKTYFKNKSKEKIIFFLFFSILGLLGLIYGIREQIPLLVIPSALCLITIFIYALYELFFYLLPFAALLFFCFYLYSHSSISNQQEVKTTQDSEKNFTNKIKK